MPVYQDICDPATGKTRLLIAQCTTCLLRPGNPVWLQPGALREIITANLREGSHGLVCHDTLAYGRYPDAGPALCRGFYDRYGQRNNFIRVMGRIGGFLEVAPPEDRA